MFNRIAADDSSSGAWEMLNKHFTPLAEVEKPTAITDWCALLLGDTEHPKDYFPRPALKTSMTAKRGKHTEEANANTHFVRCLSAAQVSVQKSM